MSLTELLLTYLLLTEHTISDLLLSEQMPKLDHRDRHVYRINQVVCKICILVNFLIKLLKFLVKSLLCRNYLVRIKV